MRHKQADSLLAAPPAGGSAVPVEGITITDAHCYEMGSGDPGFVYPGHIDKQVMVDAIHRYEIESGSLWPGDDPTFTVEDVEHRWRVPVSLEEADEHGCEAYFRLPSVEEPGSEPVTVCQP